MTRKVAVLALSLFCAILISSCVTGITMDSIQSVHRGMSHEEFKAQVKMAAKSIFSVDLEGTEYKVEIYNMQTGTQTQTQFHYSKYGSYTTTTQVPVYSDYVFIYDQNLLFWGFLNEMQKSEDELVQQLAPVISAEYKKQRAY
jgi:hypothetical protein